MAEPNPLVEVCAGIADGVRVELEAMLAQDNSKRGGERVRYAIRWTQRIAERIRGLNNDAAALAATGKGGDKLERATALLKELYPLVDRGRHTAWRAQMLQRIKEIIQD